MYIPLALLEDPICYTSCVMLHGHVARMRDRRWTKLMLKSSPIGTRTRRVGRPTMRWENSLEDFAERRLGGRMWTEAAKDQAIWKELESDFLEN